MTLTKCQAHALNHIVSHRDAPAAWVQPDDVAHPHVATEMTRMRHAHAFVAQADQSRAHLLQRLLRLFQTHAQVAQQHVKRGLAVEFNDQIAIAGSDLPGFGSVGAERLAALGDAGQQQHAVAKRHAAETPAKHATCGTLTFDVAVATDRELHTLKAAGCKPAKQVTGAGALGQIGNHVTDIRHIGVGVDERSVGLKHGRRQLAAPFIIQAVLVVWRGQRRNA